MDFLTRECWRLVQDPTFESAKKRLEAMKRETFWMTVLCETMLHMQQSLNPEERRWEGT